MKAQRGCLTSRLSVGPGRHTSPKPWRLLAASSHIRRSWWTLCSQRIALRGVRFMMVHASPCPLWQSPRGFVSEYIRMCPTGSTFSKVALWRLEGPKMPQSHPKSSKVIQGRLPLRSQPHADRPKVEKGLEVEREMAKAQAAHTSISTSGGELAWELKSP